mmetsp:Transcript_58828/g.70164  ORF Transcript_58828/g.70164 Transcript_58828/m.70164 type:complete len:438 (+) Transcript_58828:89-1402(+)
METTDVSTASTTTTTIPTTSIGTSNTSISSKIPQHEITTLIHVLKTTSDDSQSPQPSLIRSESNGSTDVNDDSSMGSMPLVKMIEELEKSRCSSPSKSKFKFYVGGEETEINLPRNSFCELDCESDSESEAYDKKGDDEQEFMSFSGGQNFFDTAESDESDEDLFPFPTLSSTSFSSSRLINPTTPSKLSSSSGSNEGIVYVSPTFMDGMEDAKAEQKPKRWNFFKRKSKKESPKDKHNSLLSEAATHDENDVTSWKESLISKDNATMDDIDWQSCLSEVSFEIDSLFDDTAAAGPKQNDNLKLMLRSVGSYLKKYHHSSGAATPRSDNNGLGSLKEYRPPSSSRLDKHGFPSTPPPPHKKSLCRTPDTLPESPESVSVSRLDDIERNIQVRIELLRQLCDKSKSDRSLMESMSCVSQLDIVEVETRRQIETLRCDI